MNVRYFRKVIKIKAEDSPNVRLALEEIARGESPSGTMVVPGVLPYSAYTHRRATWDEQHQCVGLDAEFWEGAEVLLFPPLWLNTAEMRARTLDTDRRTRREARAIGIDTAEGGDKTAMAAVDEFGLLDLEAKRTPNTAVVKGDVIAFARKWDVPPSNWVFDRGGGGKWVADVLRDEGFPVRTVGFNEVIVPDIITGMATIEEREEVRESRYAYKNRRAQMYGELALLMDPHGYEGASFAIPARFAELRRQLGLIPKLLDPGGRLYMLPKRATKPGEVCLESIMGCSPDESDAVVLAVHGMLHGERQMSAGALG